VYGAIFRNILWPLWETALNKRKTPQYLRELEKSQWLSPEDISARQDEARKQIVEYAYREVSHYKRRFDELGIVPADCLDSEVWQRIPLMTKADLQDHQQDLIAESFKDKPLIISHSGGSTGNPVEFRYDRNHYDRRTAGWYRADRWSGWDLGEKHIMFWLGVGSGVGKRKKKEKWKERLHWAMMRWKTLTITQMGPDRIRLYNKELWKYRPRSIYGISNAVYTMAQIMLNEGIKPPKVRGIVVSGEKIFPWQKEIISQAFDSPVFERYGCQEVCNISEECDQHDGMHINADALYVEIVDDEGRQLPVGETGQIVVTSFDNLGMPFIRYKMGDLGSLMPEPCPCGRGLPRIREIAGREMDMIVTPEGSICAGIMMPHFMKEFQHIRGFQFVQESLDHLRILMMVAESFDKEILAFMEEQLRRYVGPTMKIDFEFVDELERLASGKYKMVISKVKAV
jgi:phenylacetate-coenzyme A ligase PaaK-like adenylate-forming protein